MKRFGRRSDAPPPEPTAESATGQHAPLAPRVEPEVAVAAEKARVIAQLRTTVMDRIDPAVAARLSPEQLCEQLARLVHEVAGQERLELTLREQAALAEELTQDMVGYGPLDPLLRDETVTDIMVNGPDCVFVERRGLIQRESVLFRSGAQLASIAQKMAAAVGRRVDESSPLVDCRLPDGSRVNVVFPPLALDGACISIRKFAKKKIDFGSMVANGSISEPMARVLEIAGRCRLNILISGGTGSGKTTLMNALSRWIDHGERVVTIEDAAELQLQQPHVVRLETRPPNLEGRGEITQRDLLKNALRMRPDRIIVGEVRGPEAFDMLQAMNTGHDGSICTVHANTPRDALTRVENMVQMGTTSLPPRAVRIQITSAVDLIIQVQRMRDGQRRVTHVTEICGLEGEVVTLNDVFLFEYQGEDANGRIRGRWVSPGIRPAFADRLEYFGLLSAWMAATEPR
ncbi:CpaF family protein [Falsiroseomonas tokyonensis]|uniref:CpaF family protein n=1 Tax=Falsiroseomonas tokyonensis TaxID=430521 RepID=A0ABV7BP87_9PROT|nr:CpaF family protein [Falsiroseomonas tokyonensis]MBU8537355.1 CpaF family protein [Falsiroseomonas tokyonensis]